MALFTYSTFLHTQLNNLLFQNTAFYYLQVSSPDDEDHCKFSTATLPSLRGTAFLGAWTTVIIRGSNQLKLSVEEHLSVVHIFSQSRFRASTIINLNEFVHPENDVEKCRQGFIEVELVLVPNKHKKKQLELEEKDEEKTWAQSRNARATATTSSSPSAEGAAEAAPASPQIPKYKRHLVRSEMSLINPELLRLRLSLRVTPLAEWSTKPGSYHHGGAALELAITPLPYLLHSYAHGGFMGLSCSLIEDPLWKGILESEDPRAWSAVQR